MCALRYVETLVSRCQITFSIAPVKDIELFVFYKNIDFNVLTDTKAVEFCFSPVLCENCLYFFQEARIFVPRYNVATLFLFYEQMYWQKWLQEDNARLFMTFYISSSHNLGHNIYATISAVPAIVC